MYGLDPVLLETRRLILEHAGFKVESAHSRDDFAEHVASRAYGLWIFCHTVPEDQRVELSHSSSGQKTHIFQIPMLLAPDTFLSNIRSALD
jgi:DNA-binding response OmpR family regulator